MGGLNDHLNNSAVNFQSESPQPWPVEHVSGFRNRNQVFSTEIHFTWVFIKLQQGLGEGALGWDPEKHSWWGIRRPSQGDLSSRTPAVTQVPEGNPPPPHLPPPTPHLVTGHLNAATQIPKSKPPCLPAEKRKKATIYWSLPHCCS